LKEIHLPRKDYDSLTQADKSWVKQGQYLKVRKDVVGLGTSLSHALHREIRLEPGWNNK